MGISNRTTQASSKIAAVHTTYVRTNKIHARLSIIIAFRASHHHHHRLSCLFFFASSASAQTWCLLQIIITTVIVACGTLVAVAAAVYFMSGSITRPIVKMTQAARSIARDGAKTDVFGSVAAAWGGGGKGGR